MSLKAGDFCASSSEEEGKVLSVDGDIVSVLMYRDGDPTDEKKEFNLKDLTLVKEIKSQKTVHQSSFQFELKSVSEDKEFGYFEGYASVFNNEDSEMDIVLPGAFTDTLKSGRKVKMCWQHSFYDVIGGFTEMREDTKGLWVKGRINLGVEKGREAYALLKAGDLDAMSIGFTCRDREYKDGKRYVKKVDLYEVSLVTEPANKSTLVTSVKFDQLKDLGSVEALLMTKGFTSTDAKGLIRVVKELSIQREADDEVPEDKKSSEEADTEDMAMAAAFLQIKSITSTIRKK